MGEEDCARKTGLYAPWVLKKRRLVVIEFNGLRYLFNHKKHTKVYIKIIDISCNGREDEFVRHFSDMADDLAIEHLEPLFEGVDYEKFNNSHAMATYAIMRKKSPRRCESRGRT